jgi:hypothetical protein
MAHRSRNLAWRSNFHAIVSFYELKFPSSATLSGWPSSPGEFHPKALTEPCLSLSTHTARAIHRELPPSAATSSVHPVAS